MRKSAWVILIVALVVTRILTHTNPEGAAAKSSVNFPDPNLESAIRDEIGKPTGDILPSDLVTLTSLNASDTGIADLTGLDSCSNLAYLDLDSNQISDLSPLSSLTDLGRLRLDTNQISNISPLSNLTNLYWLGLSSNQISDISPLSSLTGLGHLQLDANQISDLSPLSSLTDLAWLYLDSNQISDLSPLSSLTFLHGLYLDSNQISCLSPLVANTGMGASDELYIRANPLSADSLDTFIPQLQARGVFVYYDAGPPVNFPDPNLEAAIRDEIGKPTGDILTSHLETITFLQASDRGISDLTRLDRCSNLAYLDLNSNQISDLSPLSRIPRLFQLDLSSNQISDLSPLSSLTNLWSLNLSSNQTSDISPLSSLTRLKHLSASTNQISDLSALSGLTSLYRLHLDSNQISDLSPLVANPGLGASDELYIRSNPLSADSLDTFIPQLQARGVSVDYNGGPTPPIPEASSVLLVVTGLLTLGGVAVWRRKKRVTVPDLNF